MTLTTRTTEGLAPRARRGVPNAPLRDHRPRLGNLCQGWYDRWKMEMPMPTRNINLTEHYEAFVDHQVLSGRYGNASEIVREALRLLEAREVERDIKLRALRQAAKQGFDEIDQGKGIILKGKKAIDRFFSDIESEIRGKVRRSGG
jgi:antitoxin ParD1/3/4